VDSSNEFLPTFRRVHAALGNAGFETVPIVTLSKLCGVQTEEFPKGVDTVAVAEFDTFAFENPLQRLFADIPLLRSELEDVCFKIVGRSLVLISPKRRTQAGSRCLAAT